MDDLEIRLEEYKTLRQEVLTAINNRISILSFGVASISLILYAGITNYRPAKPEDAASNTLFVGLVLFLAIPVVAVFVLRIWLGEYERSQRAGTFLVTIERKV